MKTEPYSIILVIQYQTENTLKHKLNLKKIVKQKFQQQYMKWPLVEIQCRQNCSKVS